MKAVPENELFSAYLDGELTAAEQTQVEQLLQSSPSARQLLDELRALGTVLQTLPQQSLEEDLSEKVLHLAERRILGGEADSARPAPARLPGFFRRMLSPRTIAWSATAVGVAVLLMIFNPDRPGENRELAQREPEDAAKDDAGPVMLAADKPERPIDMAGAEEDADAADDSAVAMDDPGSFAPPSDTAPETEESVTDPASHVGKRADQFKAEKPAGGRSMGERAPGGPGVMAAPPPAAVPAEEHGYQLPERVPEIGGGGLASGNVASDSFKNQPKQAGDLPLPTVRPEPMQITADQRPGEPSPYSGQIPRGIAVIRLGISREAAENLTFDSLLPVHGIVWEREPAERSAPGLSTAATPKDGGQQSVLGAVAIPLSRETAAWRLARQLRQEGAEVIDVVATHGQVEAALADLAGRESDFPTISIDPAPGIESQKTWTKYNRVAPAEQQKAPSDDVEGKLVPDTAKATDPDDPPLGKDIDTQLDNAVTSDFAQQEIGSQAAEVRSDAQTRKGVARRVRLPAGRAGGQAGQPAPVGQTLRPSLAPPPPAPQSAPAAAPLISPMESALPLADGPTLRPGHVAGVLPKRPIPPRGVPKQGESIDQKAPSMSRQVAETPEERVQPRSVAPSRPAQGGGQAYRYGQAQPRYRVLFVLRDVGGIPPSASVHAATMPAEPPVESSEVEVPSNAPATDP